MLILDYQMICLKNVLLIIVLFVSQCLLNQHLETVIKSRIPGLQSLISKTIMDLEMELNRIGKPIAADTGVSHILQPSPNTK